MKYSKRKLIYLLQDMLLNLLALILFIIILISCILMGAGILFDSIWISITGITLYVIIGCLGMLMSRK